MSDLRRSVSPSHLELLLQYLEQHPGLALAGPRSRHDQLQARRLWEKVARMLNKVDGTVVKSGKGWCRYWADLKCKTRRKYKRNCHIFTQWEQRVIKLLTDDDGTLLPNAHQLDDKEYQNITKPSTKKIKRSHSDAVDDINQESNTNSYKHTDKIYIVNHIAHENDNKTKIYTKNSNKILEVQSSREMYNLEEQNNSAEDHNSIAELNNSTEVQNMYSPADHTRNPSIEDNSKPEHNSTSKQMYSTADHNLRVEEHKYSASDHNNSKVEHNMYSTSELRTKKTIEELRKEILEFQLKRQKELFEIEKRERYERHQLEMNILRLKRDILVKELNNLT